MRYSVGVDLGTTFTSAAVSGPGGTRVVSLSPEVTVPSVAYRTPDGTLLTGTAALAAASDPALVARGFKRRLGDPTPLVLGGKPLAPAELMAAQLRDVLTLVTDTEGAPPETVMLTCPAIWGPYRREHFTAVPRLAGVHNYQLVTEPEAAATHYSMERRLGDGEVVAVYDLGGGTFDTTILRMRAGGMEILGSPDGIEHMGGIDFDETLMAQLNERLDGAISELDPEDPVAARSLAAIRAMCVRAKEELSIEPDIQLAVPLPFGPREVTITRLEFNEMIRPSVQLTTQALHRTISSAGIRAEDLSAILLAGGSSRIPLVSQLVADEFGKPVRVTLHPKFTVALGAAAIATARTHPAPAQEPAPAAQPDAKRKKLVPAAIAAVVLLVAAVTTFALTRGDNTEAGTGNTADAAQKTNEEDPAGIPADALRLYDNDVVSPWVGMVASEENWGGAEFGPHGASQSAIAATLDQKGLRVNWVGNAPGQVYLQSQKETQDLKSFVDDDGALVFDIVVNSPPVGRTALAVHCVFPCGGEVAATQLFQDLPKGKRTTVMIPLSCFTTAGLDPTKVNTPFLVFTEEPFDATFSAIRWQPKAATSAKATPCENLR